MHFSIPDTLEISANGTNYTGYHLHVNGVFHCIVRYRQIFSLYEEIKKEHPSNAILLPKFPPKKLLPLSIAQLEERRLMLEKYIQAVGQDCTISESKIFRSFLLNAQQLSSNVPTEPSTIDIHLTNGLPVTLKIQTNENTGEILYKLCENIRLDQELSNYFCLFLEKIEEDGEFTLQRRLQDFESPYISLTTLPSPHRIILRKSYWHPKLDLVVMKNKVALNLLYLQTVSDVEREWVLTTKAVQDNLAACQSRGEKEHYMQIARKLKFYGYLQFKPCSCDYPYPNAQVLVSAGNRELNIRVNDDIRQGSFKVTRMRCWRITTLHGNENEGGSNLELSFEYLMGRNKLQWITISSEQAVLMSMCLQSMVEELLDDSESQSNSNRQLDHSSSSETTTPVVAKDISWERPRSSKRAVNGFVSRAFKQNECFANDIIGDDDL